MSAKSRIQKKDGTCYLCRILEDNDERQQYLEKHHVFGGPRRDISEREGLFVWLCYEHHRGNNSVHMKAELSERVKRIAQMKWEENHTREEWMALMGKNYT